MSTLPGTWQLSMKTPIGTVRATLTFHDDQGTLTGTAHGTGESVPLRDIATTPADDGERVTWSQSITKPLRLNLDFDVVVTGEQMHGHSRAGRLPRTTVSGTRVTES
jgi:hypothetical protein